MKINWLLFVVFLTTLAPFVIYFYDDFGFGTQTQQSNSIATIDYQRPDVEKRMEPGAQFGITSMEILDGYRFQVTLSNGAWIEAHLASATKHEATPVVVEMLRSNSYPSILLYRQSDDFWIVDVIVNVQGQRQSLTQTLRTQGLTY